MKKSDVLRGKSKAFALRIINLYKYLCKQKSEYVLSKQVLRSGTSIGANISEGGLGSMRQWEAFGLAQKDKIHFTRKGYKLMGDMMFRAIIESYNETMMRRN